MMKKLYLLFLFISMMSGLNAMISKHVILPTVSIMDNLPLKILAYPNPAKDKLFIESESPLSTLIVYNLLGQKMKQFSLEGAKKFEFSVADLPSGTYILTVQSGNQTVNQKITKVD